MQGIDFLFSIAVLVFSVVIHEVSHGYAANALGDPTAKYAGRLTLNPLPHLDAFGSLLLPLITYWAGGFIFGWAKPVPYNPYNLSNQKWGPAAVAAAGPAANLLVALIFGIFVRIATAVELPSEFASIATTIVFINILLAVFNFVPIPPLDGSKVLFSALPSRYGYVQSFLEQWGFVLLLLFIFFFFQVLFPVISLLFRLFTGL
ncbi:MAG: site-2 protease family protein [Candidatus Niyogibacteria bacterium]|nr:site-2 protease family protein [Candidatus Niyogibacteria bacterium]